MGKNKIILLIILSFFLVNCGSYQYSSYHNVKSVLAVTEKGDTIAVPLREFERNKYESYTRFNWNNQWYWNNWRYSYNWGFNNWWHWNNPYWSNNTIIIPRQTRVRPYVQPRNTPPRTRPRFREPNERIRVNTPRGSNNQYTPRNNNNSNTRTRVNVGRRSDGGRRNNQ